MALPAEVRRLFNLLINSAALRYSSLPANVTGVAVTGAAGANTKGAYAEIAATVGAADVLLVGAAITVNAVDEYNIDLASGAAAAEVVLVANLTIEREQVTAAGQLLHMPVWLPFGIFIANGTRVAARLASVGGAGDTADVHMIFLTAF